MERASHLLSRLSRHVGFVLAPDIARTSFRHLDLVALAYPRILVVMVSSTGLRHPQGHRVRGAGCGPRSCRPAPTTSTRTSPGMSLADIRSQLIELMTEEKALYDKLLQKVVALGGRAFEPAGEASVYLDGTSNILAQAEFEDLERMRAIFRTFEEKGRLVRILNACLSGEGIRVLIGRENPDPDLRDLSLVTARCRLEGEERLGLGVLGSTRMEYAHVVALVDHVARAVSDVLRRHRE